jgi:dTMP kinase
MYQGLRGPGLRRIVDDLHELMIGREPDLTFIIDMDPATGHARAKGRQGSEERFEDFGTDLQARMRAGFLELAAAEPDRCVVVDGDRTPEAVAADVAGIALERLRG